MKRILTHRQPDLDAVVSAWLAQDFLFGKGKADVRFVGRKISDRARASADCLVDVGNAYDLERLWFDHKPPAFDDRNKTSAAKLVWEYLLEIGREVSHLEALVQVTFEGDTRRYTESVKQSRIDGPHAQLKDLRGKHGDDEVVYQKMVRWLRRQYG